MRKAIFGLLALSLSLGLLTNVAPAGGKDKPRKIVLVGMDRDHGKGEHEYMAGLAILAECLKQTPGVEVTTVKLSRKDKGWPEQAKAMEEANAVVCFMYAAGDHFLNNKERREKLEALMKKGTGFVALHWAVEGPKKVGDAYMEILGGYYEPGYSKNPHNLTKIKTADPKHPVGFGWKDFEARDEWYFKIRLLPDAKPVVTAESLTDRDKSVHKGETIGWTYVRKDQQGPLGPGRSFGFTGCHFHVNFGIPEFRRLITNGILWTAAVDVPQQGAPVALKAPVPKIPDESKSK